MRSFSFNTLGTWCEELIHWKIPWCWERLKAGGEGDGRRWDGWMASPIWWIWVWAMSGCWWWTEKLVCLSPWGCRGWLNLYWLVNITKAIEVSSLTSKFSYRLICSVQCPWDSSGKVNGVGCHFLLFPTQRSNPCLLYCQADYMPVFFPLN